MDETQPLPTPFMDWYGVWPSHRKLEADGTRWSQDPPQGVRLSIEPAQVSPVFFAPERPWEQGANLHLHTLLHEEGRYRLWYGASQAADPAERYVCYAESEDGFSWQRPELGLVEYRGSRRNNLLCAGQDHYLGAVFRDPSAPPEERYKAIDARGTYWREGRPDPSLDSARFKELLIALDLGGVPPEERRKRLEIRQAVCASVSPDGLRWRNLEEPILDVGNTALDTHNLCTFDPHEGKYVAYLRGHLERRRLVRRAEGRDFRRLEAPRPCLMCDPQDPIDDDIYTSCYCPYPGGQRLYLMFPSVYHRLASTVDIQLALSRDSYTWQRPERAPIIDRRCGEVEYNCLYASPELIAPGDGTWRLAFAGMCHPHDFRDRGAPYPQDGEWRWAQWGEDRLAGLEAGGEGRVTLVQRRCAGRQLRLNYRTERGGWIKAELVQTPGTPPKPVEALPGFSLEEAEPLCGDKLWEAAHWKGNSSLETLKGREVSVRLHLHRAEVFAISW